MAENPRIEELRRRVQADPASIAFAALAEEFRRVGRYDDAVETCRTGLLRHPAYLSARVTLGRALIETGDFDAAREELETVLRSAPENLAAIRGLAQIHERLGHSTEMDPHLADMMETMHAEALRAAAMAPPPAPPEPEVSLAPEPAVAPEPLSLESAASIEVTPSLESDASIEPEPSLETEPSYEPEPSFAGPAPIALAPEPINPIAPQPAVDAVSLGDGEGFPLDTSAEPPSTDPFAAFAPAASSAPKHDLSFDLSNAFAIQPKAAPAAEPAVDFSLAPRAEPIDEIAEAFPVASLNAESLEAAPADAESIDAESLDAAPIAASAPEFDLDLDVEPQPEPEAEPVLQMAAMTGPDPATLATLARLERFLGAIESLRA